MTHIERLTQKMKTYEIANMIVSDPYTIKYLTGYFTDPGERLLALLVKAEGDVYLFRNQLFPTYTKDNLEVVDYMDGEDIIAQIGHRLDAGVTSIDKFWPSQFLIALMDAHPKLQAENHTYIIDDLRGIKDEQEIEIMAEASRLNDLAMEALVNRLSEGLSEVQLADYLKEVYSESGHSGFSFPPIVGYGDHGADPHHTTTDRKPQVGDPVIFDIGGVYQGYSSDMTRTVFYGQPSDKALEVYQVVKDAIEAATAMVRPGISFREIDLTARDIITKAGYGPYFTHRLGHFIGQEGHEAGDVSQHNEALTQIGQVFSIEPGIYLPGEFGVRIEDLVVVTEGGCRVLNHYPKDVIIIEPDA